MAQDYLDRLKEAAPKKDFVDLEDVFDNGVNVSSATILGRKAVMSVILTGKIFEKCINSELSKINLCLQDYLILIAIYFTEKKLNQNELAQKMFSSKANISSTINKLEQNELIKKEINENNKKENYIVITQIGENLLKNILDQFEKKYQSLFNEEASKNVIISNKILREDLKNKTSCNN